MDGGESYCAACLSHFATCPYDLRAPVTHEGILAWEVIRHSAGHVCEAMGGVSAIDFSVMVLHAHAMSALNPLLVDVAARDRAIVVKACLMISDRPE